MRPNYIMTSYPYPYPKFLELACWTSFPMSVSEHHSCGLPLPTTHNSRSKHCKHTMCKKKENKMWLWLGPIDGAPSVHVTFVCWWWASIRWSQIWLFGSSVAFGYGESASGVVIHDKVETGETCLHIHLILVWYFGLYHRNLKLTAVSCSQVEKNCDSLLLVGFCFLQKWSSVFLKKMRANRSF